MNQEKYEVCIVGLGYIGLPTAILSVLGGFQTYGYDISEDRLRDLNSGISRYEEPGLNAALREARDSGLLSLGSELPKSKIYLICVPTPVTSEGVTLQADLSYVFHAVQEIIPQLENGDLIIVESTCPIGTTDKIMKTIERSLGNMWVGLAYCPERILPGNVMMELKQNSRIIGGIDENSSLMARDFYARFVSADMLVCSNPRTAEMCKLAENSFRDLNIAFANQLSLIADREGVNVHEVISAANKHPRVDILDPGIGVGGHCLAVDPYFLVETAADLGELTLVARKINKQKTDYVASKIVSDLKSNGHQTILVLGLTYKPDIDDIRESPALDICHKLSQCDFEIMVFDPYVLESFDSRDFKLVSDLNSLDQVDAVVQLVNHKIYGTEAFKRSIANLSDSFLAYC